MLIATVSAFTLAHSITLAGAALGVVRLQPAPVEAMIALSIAFVAAQLVPRLRSRPGTAQRYPWLVALLFGLLHGFGFAGALRQVGLPDAQIAGALLLFNLGIEAGQLLFVVLVFALLQALRHRLPRVYQSAMAPMAYVIGSIAACWLVQRVAAFT
jgi:hypothetical protein